MTFISIRICWFFGDSFHGVCTILLNTIKNRFEILYRGYFVLQFKPRRFRSRLFSFDHKCIDQALYCYTNTGF